MLDYRRNEIEIVEGVKAYLSTEERPCEVIRQNQVAKIPPYPYVSYTLTTPLSEFRGTFSIAPDGTRYRSALMTLSFTVQSDDQEEAIALAYKLHDFFSVAGVTYLADKGITVRRVRDISTRDNLITVQYEYRNGLDVTLGLLYTISADELVIDDEIHEANITRRE